MDISIKKAIMHIVDVDIGFPILSDICLDIDETFIGLLLPHIEKIITSDERKNCNFANDSQFASLINDVENSFVQITKTVSSRLFSIMMRNIEIPKADLVFVYFELANASFFSMIKMDYRNSFIHFVQKDNGNNIIRMIEHKTTLPSPSNKINEAFFIQLNNHSVQLVEKKYSIDGVKQFYLSNYLLGCTDSISEKQKFLSIKKTAEQVSDLYGLSDQPSVAAAIYEEVYNTEKVTPETISNKLFKDIPEATQAFASALQTERIGMQDSLVVSPTTISKLQKQSIKSSSGIEIKIPISLYQDANSLEFINNPDGTISLLIKNVMMN